MRQGLQATDTEGHGIGTERHGIQKDMGYGGCGG